MQRVSLSREGKSCESLSYAFKAGADGVGGRAVASRDRCRGRDPMSVDVGVAAYDVEQRRHRLNIVRNDERRSSRLERVVAGRLYRTAQDPVGHRLSPPRRLLPGCDADAAGSHGGTVATHQARGFGRRGNRLLRIELIRGALASPATRVTRDGRACRQSGPRPSAQCSISIDELR